MSPRISLATFALLFAAGLASAGTWERFRGPGGNGTANDQNLPVEFGDDKNVLWKVAIPGLGNSSPIVWNDLLLLQTSSKDGSERKLLCLDTKTGKTVWERKFSGGTAKTHKKNTLASATPVTDGSAIYLPVWDGKDVTLHALTMKGEPLWKKELGEFKSQHGAGASAMIYEDKVFFPLDMDGKSVFYAFDKKTGNEVWSTPRKAYRACYNPAYILEKGATGPELIVSSTTSITSYNPHTGSRNWDWEWSWPKTVKFPLRTIGTAVTMKGMLFAFSGDGGGDRYMVGLDLPSAPSARPTQKWDNPKDFPYVPGVLTRGDNLYFVNDAGFAGCFDARTGKKVWLNRLEGASAFTSSPVLVDGKVYAASEDGDVFVFAAEPTFKLLAQNRLGERLMASPAVADGRLYIRGANHLYCFGKKD